MVGFDEVGILAAGGLNHVRINRALRQPVGIAEFTCFFFEDFDKYAADNLTLLFGFINAFPLDSVTGI